MSEGGRRREKRDKGKEQEWVRYVVQGREGKGKVRRSRVRGGRPVRGGVNKSRPRGQMMAVKKGKWEESGKERREGQQGRMKRRK